LFDPENILKAAKYEYRTHHRREYQEDTVNNLIIEYFFNPETKEFKIGGLAERGDYAMVQFVDDKGKVYGGLGAYRVLKVEAGRTVIDRNDEVFQADRTVIDREINPIVQRYNRGVEFR
jgi:hypothetical protein